MITAKVTLYRCEHCRKKKALRPMSIRRHEINCFANPNRTPYAGELSEVRGEGDFGGAVWRRHPVMAPWWPGSTGQIFTGARWLPVPGYERMPSRDGEGYADEERWPVVSLAWVEQLGSNSFPDTRPWYLRLDLLDLPQERLAEHLRTGLFLDVEERSVRIAGVTIEGDVVCVKLDEWPRRVLTFQRGAIVRLASLTDDREAAAMEAARS